MYIALSIKQYQAEFIEFCIQCQALQFGEFTLKSGRQSPYFYNSGLFRTGYALAKLGRFYASAIQDAGLQFDVLFGPAYKGIPLVSATAIALAEQFSMDAPYCFNRKVAKDHGEGGSLVGAPLIGDVLLVDDVITAGTTIKASAELIQSQGARLSAVLVSLDRQERSDGQQSAIQALSEAYDINVIPIITASQLLEHLQTKPELQKYAEKIAVYRQQHGV